jgi:hypothetical protein
MASNLQISTTSVDFGSVVTGTTVSVELMLSNNPYGDPSPSPCTITAGDFSTGDYSDDAVLPATIPPFTSGSFHIFFTGLAPGPTAPCTLTITSDDPGSPIVITLTSTSVAPGVKALSISPTLAAFPNTKVGMSSATQIFTVTNTGTVDISVTGATFPTSFAAAAPIPGYPVTVHSGDTLQIGAKFSPIGQGYVFGILDIASDVAGSPTHLSLYGVGYLIDSAYIASGNEVVLAAFGNTVLQFDETDFNCEEPASLTRDWNLSGPGIEDNLSRIQLNHEANGPATLTYQVDNRHALTIAVPLTLSSDTDEAIHMAFGDLSITDEVLHTILFRDANSGPAVITSYILRYNEQYETKPEGS